MFELSKLDRSRPDSIVEALCGLYKNGANIEDVLAAYRIGREFFLNNRGKSTPPDWLTCLGQKEAFEIGWQLEAQGKKNH